MTKCKVKINKEIRDYTEAIFFGLSLRQFIFSVLACGIAVGLYFLLHPYMSMETGSWICVLGAAPPCVVFGFVIPRSVQQVIPIETIWSDGIFKIGRNKFARTYKFTDINYAVASKVDKSTSSNSMVQEKRLLGVETNITNWQRRQNANNNFSAVIPYDLEQQRNTSKYLHRTDGIYHKCRCRLWSGEIRKFDCTVCQ